MMYWKPYIPPRMYFPPTLPPTWKIAVDFGILRLEIPLSAGEVVLVLVGLTILAALRVL